MDVFLLCAGFGTRLRPLTNHIPKCLAPVGDIPLLAIWLDTLSTLNFINKVFINTHYLSDQVKDFLNENSFNLDIELVVEEEILGTTKSIRSQLSSSQASEFMIIHGDNFSLQDFNGMYQLLSRNSANQRLSGLALGFRSQDYDNCGFYRYNKVDSRIESFIEKPGSRVEGLANGAIFMLTKELLLKSLECTIATDFCKDSLPYIINNLYMFEATGIHVDIGLPSSLASVQSFRKLFDKIILNENWHKAYMTKVSEWTIR